MGAFDHLSDVKLFQLQSMYDFMYAVASPVFADFHLEIQLDASKHIYPPLPPPFFSNDFTIESFGPVGHIRRILSLGPAYLLHLLTNPTEAPSHLLSAIQKPEQYFLSESLHAEIVINRSLDHRHWQKLAGTIDCLTDAGNSIAEETLKSASMKRQVHDWLPF
jgi:hypothetical protein